MGAERDIDGMCREPLPGWAVSKREGPNGRMLDYADQYYVISRLNEVFGPTGWSARAVRMEQTDAREVNTSKGQRWAVAYLATVELSVGEVTKPGTAVGSGLDRDLAKAMHSAATEAETDALKRAARLYGDTFGFALYDPRKANVDRSARREDAPQSPPSNGQAQRTPPRQNGDHGAGSDEGDKVTVEGTLKFDEEPKETKNGRPYLRAKVNGPHGEITFWIWDYQGHSLSKGARVRATGETREEEKYGWRLDCGPDSFEVLG